MIYMTILKRVVQGALNGFPLVRSVVKAVKKDSLASVVNEVSTPEGKEYKIDYVVLVTELITVSLVIAFVFGKVSLEDIEKILGLIK